MTVREDLLAALEPLDRITNDHTLASLAAAVKASLTTVVHKLADAYDPIIAVDPAGFSEKAEDLRESLKDDEHPETPVVEEVDISQGETSEETVEELRD